MRNSYLNYAAVKNFQSPILLSSSKENHMQDTFTRLKWWQFLLQNNSIQMYIKTCKRRITGCYNKSEKNCPSIP